MALVLALLATLWAPALAGAADEVAFTIKDSRITESSGLVRNYSHDGWWTANDSGDGGVVYALNDSGEVTGSFRYAASPSDVESLARYGRRLYVADIGDNAEKRDFVTVYYFSNPPTDGSTVQYRSYDFAYPDGPHDAETLLVDGAGRLYIVTKGKKGAIYAAPGVPSRSALNRLVKVGSAPAYVTDGVFLPDNKRIALRTYVSVIVLDAITYKTIGSAAAPVQPQGETIALSLNGKRLMLGSEGNPSKMYVVDIPKSKGEDVPKGTSAPPDASASPSASSDGSGDGDAGTDTDTDVDGGGANPNRQGTLLALGLAGVVAVVAGGVVLLIRRP
ncbi:hypothetical protein [Microlunatus ginsengisoli]|uniref:Esterase-like activity of phytase family protein n=1 Tax=Microlunatus ginsengisoli TaxID=363863 RepID=A0ABP6ZJ25_9ACTN